MKQAQREDRLYGCLLVRGKWETYGVYIDIGTPRAYLTVEGVNRYYLGLKLVNSRWEGRVLLGVSNDNFADSEKPLSPDLLIGTSYKKDELRKAQDRLLVLGEEWIESNDGGIDRSMWNIPEEQPVIERPKLEDDDV